MRYLVGALAARTGDSMCGPALMLAGLWITGSAASASVPLGALMVSAAVGGPVVGVMLDRSQRPNRILAGALGIYASALVVILAGLGHMPLTWIAAIALPAGLLSPALSAGWTAQLPMVARPQALARATVLDAMSYDIAGLIGPALAGVVAGLTGSASAVIASAILIGMAIPVAAALPASSQPRAVLNNAEHRNAVRRRRSHVRPSLIVDLAAGFRVITGIRPLRRATAVTVISCMGEGMFVTCCPLLGTHYLGSANRGTLLLSVVAVSGMAANALLVRNPAPYKSDTVIGVSTAVIAVAVLVTTTGEPVLIIAAAALIGVGEGPQLTALFTIRHREAPQQLRGQVFTTGASLKTTAYALGAPLAGALATHSLHLALTTVVAVQAVATLTCFLMREPPKPWQTANETKVRSEGT